MNGKGKHFIKFRVVILTHYFHIIELLSRFYSYLLFNRNVDLFIHDFIIIVLDLNGLTLCEEVTLLSFQ